MADHFALDGPPDEAQVKRLHTSLQTIWQDAQADWKEVDTYVNATYTMWASPFAARPKLYTGRAAAKLRAATDVLVPFRPKLHRSPVGEGEDHKADADTVENFLDRVGLVAAAKEAVDPYKAMWHHLMRYGYGVSCGMRYDESYRRERPRKRGDEKPGDYDARVEIWDATRRNWCPFRYEAPHPASVLMNPYEATPRVAIVLKRMYAVEVEEEVKRAGRRARQELGPYVLPDDPYEVVKCIEFWSQYHHALLVEMGTMLYVERNAWGFQPYSHGFAGWGGNPTDLEGENPRYLAKGILTDGLPLFRAYDQQQTAKHTVMMTAAFLHRVVDRDPIEAAAALANDGLLPGKKAEWAWEDMPEFSQSLFKLTDETDRDIETVTVRGDIAGVRQEGVTTVGQQALLSAAALLTFGTAVGQMNRLATQINRNGLQLVSLASKTYGLEAHTVGDITLKAEQLHGNFVVDAEFAVVNPAILLQEKQTAMEERREGLIGNEEYWKAARYEDTTAIRDSILRDRALARPEMVEAMDAVTLEALGFKEQAERIRERLKEMQFRAKMMAEGWVPPPGASGQGQARPPQSAMNPASPQTAVDQMRNGAEAAAQMPTPEAPYGRT